MGIFSRKREKEGRPDGGTGPASDGDDPSATGVSRDIHATIRDSLEANLDVLRYVRDNDPFDPQVIETYVTMATRLGACDDQLAAEIRATPPAEWPELRTMLSEVHLEGLRTGMELLKSIGEPEPEDATVLADVVDTMSGMVATAREPSTDAAARVGTHAEEPPAESTPDHDPGLAALGQGDAAARQAAVAAVVEVGPSAVEGLYRLLESPNDDVREDARRALIGIGPVDALFEAAHFADTEPMPLRKEIAAVLGAFDDPRAIDLLVEIGVRVDFGNEHRIAAANALAQVGEPAVERLLGLAAGDVAVEQELAARALGQIGDDRALEPLAELAGSKPRHHQPFVRSAARHALEELTGQDFGADAEAWRSWVADRA